MQSEMEQEDSSRIFGITLLGVGLNERNHDHPARIGVSPSNRTSPWLCAACRPIGRAHNAHGPEVRQQPGAHPPWGSAVGGYRPSDACVAVIC